MSGNREDERLRSALAELRRVMPRDDEVVSVLRRAATAPRARRSGTVAAAAAVVLIAVGSALAVPSSRSAIRAALDGSGAPSVLPAEAPAPRGGGHEVAQPPRALLPPDPLGWVRGSADRPVTIARLEERSLVAYRGAGTGTICLGLAASPTCADERVWRARFFGSAVLPLRVTRSPLRGHVTLWGVSTSAVATVELVYADRATLRVPTGVNGFAIVGPVRPAPRALIARDSRGVMVVRIDVTRLPAWRLSQ